MVVVVGVRSVLSGASWCEGLGRGGAGALLLIEHGGPGCRGRAEARAGGRVDRSPVVVPRCWLWSQSSSSSGRGEAERSSSSKLSRRAETESGERRRRRRRRSLPPSLPAQLAPGSVPTRSARSRRPATPSRPPTTTRLAHLLRPHLVRLSTSAPLQPPHRDMADKFKAEGNIAFGQKKWLKAAKLYGQAIALDKDDTAKGALYSNRSAAYVQLGKLDQGASTVARARSLSRAVAHLLRLRPQRSRTPTTPCAADRSGPRPMLVSPRSGVASKSSTCPSRAVRPAPSPRPASSRSP